MPGVGDLAGGFLPVWLDRSLTPRRAREGAALQHAYFNVQAVEVVENVKSICHLMVTIFPAYQHIAAATGAAAVKSALQAGAVADNVRSNVQSLSNLTVAAQVAANVQLIAQPSFTQAVQLASLSPDDQREVAARVGKGGVNGWRPTHNPRQHTCPWDGALAGFARRGGLFLRVRLPDQYIMSDQFMMGIDEKAPPPPTLNLSPIADSRVVLLSTKTVPALP